MIAGFIVAKMLLPDRIRLTVECEDGEQVLVMPYTVQSRRVRIGDFVQVNDDGGALWLSDALK